VGVLGRNEPGMGSDHSDEARTETPV
jgi:hypothetical protein